MGESGRIVKSALPSSASLLQIRGFWRNVTKKNEKHECNFELFRGGKVFNPVTIRKIRIESSENIVNLSRISKKLKPHLHQTASVEQYVPLRNSRRRELSSSWSNKVTARSTVNQRYARTLSDQVSVLSFYKRTSNRVNILGVEFVLLQNKIAEV